MPSTTASRDERIVLSRRDSERVLALLENPPQPTPALIEAARRRPARHRCERPERCPLV